MRRALPIILALAPFIGLPLTALAAGANVNSIPLAQKTPAAPARGPITASGSAQAKAIAASKSVTTPNANVRDHRWDSVIQAVQQNPPTVKPGSCGSAADNTCVVKYNVTTPGPMPAIVISFDRTTGQLLPGELNKITAAMKKGQEMSERAAAKFAQQGPVPAPVDKTKAIIRDHRH
jgi:hypothetical protein